MRPSDLRIPQICEQLARLQIEVIDAAGDPRLLAIKTPATARLSLAEEVLPVLQPRTNGFIFNVSPMRRDSFGADAGYKSITFELHYALFFAKLSEEATALDLFSPLVNCAVSVASQFADLTNKIDAATEIVMGGIPGFGPVIDGTATPYHGTGIFFQIMQYLEG